MESIFYLICCENLGGCEKPSSSCESDVTLENYRSKTEEGLERQDRGAELALSGGPRFNSQPCQACPLSLGPAGSPVHHWTWAKNNKEKGGDFMLWPILLIKQPAENCNFQLL